MTAPPCYVGAAPPHLRQRPPYDILSYVDDVVALTAGQVLPGHRLQRASLRFLDFEEAVYDHALQPA